MDNIFANLLNTDNGLLLPDLPPPADQDISIWINPHSFEEAQKVIQVMKSNKDSGLDDALTTGALQEAATGWQTWSTNFVL